MSLDEAGNAGASSIHDRGDEPSPPRAGRGPGWGKERAGRTGAPRGGGSSGRMFGRDGELTM